MATRFPRLDAVQFGCSAGFGRRCHAGELGFPAGAVSGAQSPTAGQGLVDFSVEIEMRHAQAIRTGIERRSAFSLIELVVAMLVLGILAAVAAPRFAAQLQHHRLEMAVRRVIVDLEAAQSLAYHADAPRTVSFTTGANGYRINGLLDPDRPQDADYNVFLNQSPYHCTLGAVSFSGGTSVTFNGHGLPDHGGSIQIRSGNLLRTVTIEAGSGRIGTL